MLLAITKVLRLKLSAIQNQTWRQKDRGRAYEGEMVPCPLGVGDGEEVLVGEEHLPGALALGMNRLELVDELGGFHAACDEEKDAALAALCMLAYPPSG
jgi:hypothetical protein